jgi:hypothetical protein
MAYSNQQNADSLDTWEPEVRTLGHDIAQAARGLSELKKIVPDCHGLSYL